MIAVLVLAGTAGLALAPLPFDDTTTVRNAISIARDGYAGYFADPDGHCWEIARSPHFTLDAEGSLQLPD